MKRGARSPHKAPGWAGRFTQGPYSTGGKVMSGVRIMAVVVAPLQGGGTLCTPAIMDKENRDALLLERSHSGTMAAAWDKIFKYLEVEP